MLVAISTFKPLPELTPEDEGYIRKEFFPLEDLCLGRQSHASEYRNKIRSRLNP
jgi:hypothetical protein